MFDGFDPCCFGGAESRGMEKFDEFGHGVGGIGAVACMISIGKCRWLGLGRFERETP